MHHSYICRLYTLVVMTPVSVQLYFLLRPQLLTPRLYPCRFGMGPWVQESKSPTTQWKYQSVEGSVKEGGWPLAVTHITIFVSIRTYPLEVLYRVCYIFTDHYYLWLEPHTSGDICIHITPKAGVLIPEQVRGSLAMP